MELVEFPEHNMVIAKDQRQYRPMPAHLAPDGVVTCCWKLTPEEIDRVVETGVLWHQIMTFGAPLQPQLLLVDSPWCAMSPATPAPADA